MAEKKQDQTERKVSVFVSARATDVSIDKAFELQADLDELKAKYGIDFLVTMQQPTSTPTQAQ